MTETYAEHLAWAKARALEYMDLGELEMAVSSMTNDMTKHMDSDQAVAQAMAGTRLLLAESLSEKAIRAWIEAFR
jgi:hypothetical protein